MPLRDIVSQTALRASPFPWGPDHRGGVCRAFENCLSGYPHNPPSIQSELFCTDAEKKVAQSHKRWAPPQAPPEVPMCYVRTKTPAYPIGPGSSCPRESHDIDRMQSFRRGEQFYTDVNEDRPHIACGAKRPILLVGPNVGWLQDVALSPNVGPFMHVALASAICVDSRVIHRRTRRRGAISRERAPYIFRSMRRAGTFAYVERFPRLHSVGQL